MAAITWPAAEASRVPRVASSRAGRTTGSSVRSLRQSTKRALRRKTRVADQSPSQVEEGLVVLGLRPVFQAQSRDPAELALVVRDEDQLPPDRLRRDQRVERTDGRARALQLRADARIRDGVARGELDDRQRPEEVLDQAHGLHGRRALCRARAELGLGDDADRDVRATPREHPFQNRRVLLQGVDAGIRIEQVLHSSFSRSSAWPCGGLVKSSGAPAKESTYPSGHSSAGSRMTAPPSRRTSTVSVSKRNSFGRRTAWLRPVQKTFARLAFGFAMIDTNDTYHTGRGQVEAARCAWRLSRDSSRRTSPFDSPSSCRAPTIRRRCSMKWARR